MLAQLVDAAPGRWYCLTECLLEAVEADAAWETLYWIEKTNGGLVWFLWTEE
jgi:hypothetical protein